MHIVITGAASAIAQACARRWAKTGAAFFLIDRDQRRLEVAAQDLTVRGAKKVVALTADLTDHSRHQSLWQEAQAALGTVDLLLIAHGTLPKQAECEQNWEKAYRELDVNFLSVASLLTHAANYFAKERRGTIAVISSVAGDRGRQSNYVYGTAKSAVSIFTQGLRNRLAPLGVHVLTIKPGFVDTPMTTDFKKGLLWVQPDVVARRIVAAIVQRREVVYAPWFWRYLMLVIRLIPERVFKRLKL